MVDETKTPVTKKKVAKKKVAKKTSTRRTPARKKVAVKKKVAETKFELEVTKDEAGFSDTEEKTIHATDSGDALAKLDRETPEGYDAVTIKKDSFGASKKPDTAPVAAEPVKAVSKTAVEKKEVKVASHKLTEGFDSADIAYPYAIVLPMGYEKFVNMVAGTVNKPVSVMEHRGRLKTTLDSSEAMEEFISSLIEMVKDEEHTDKATVIVKGIVASTKRR